MQTERCQQWIQRFWNRTFLGVKRTNKSKDCVIVNCQ